MMQIRIEVRQHENGEYQALCQEIGVSCQGCSLEEVLERMKNLLSFYFAAPDEGDALADGEMESRKQLCLYLKGKNLFLPPEPKIH